MRRIKRFSSKRSELLFRTLAILLPLISVVLLLSQSAFAQNTYVITDGERILIHTSSATDPKEVLNEAGLALGTEDTYTTQGGDGVSEITVRRNQTVYIDHCGQPLTVEAQSETVGDLLARLDITLDEDTTVSTALDTVTYNGMTLTIARTIHTTEVYTLAIPYETTYCTDPTLESGQRVVISEGQAGEMVCTAEVIYRNGIETSRNVIKQILNRQATPRVIAVGSAVELTEAEITDADTSDFWFEGDDEDSYEDWDSEDASGRDYSEEWDPEEEPAVDYFPDFPVIADGTIITPSGEVLTYTGTMSVLASAYTKTDEGCDDWTATGTLARYGAIAVDPRMIPYGTRMYIVTDDGAYVYGISTAEDCGGSIKGNRVDLYFDTTAECFQFGMRDATIYFLA